MKTNKIFLVVILVILSFKLSAQNVIGTVSDLDNQETLIGAYVTVSGENTGAVTDFDGKYALNLSTGKHTLIFSYISYESDTIEVSATDQQQQLDITLGESGISLNTIEIVGRRRTDTELALVKDMKSSLQVVSGISSQQISKTLDRDAGEVVKRIPGVTIIGGKYIVVRGLNQRYNSVWLNGAATPSTEADSRAFSFDVLPSSLLDNIQVVKSPTPELPADFSGGFIKIETKNSPKEKMFSLSYTTSYQTNTSLKEGLSNSQTPADYIGFGAGIRKLPKDFPSSLEGLTTTEKIPYTLETNRGWDKKSFTIPLDQRFSASFNKEFYLGDTKSSNISAINYSNTYKNFEMNNTRYGIYQIEEDEPSINKDFYDCVYQNQSKIGLFSNFSFIINPDFRIEFRNFFNQIGNQSIRLREGIDYDNDYHLKEQELLYYNRSIYSGQLSGDHSFNEEKTSLDWTAGYSYSNKNEPDRKIITSRLNDDTNSLYYEQYRTEGNDIRRFYQGLNEHTVSLKADFVQELQYHNWKPSLKAGVYNEYKQRDFEARNFVYNFNMNKLPSDFKYKSIDEMFEDQYITSNGVSLQENTNKSDSYTAENIMIAAYIAANLPAGELFNFYAGVRAEHNTVRLVGYESDGIKPVNINNSLLDFFPSLNSNYIINDQNQIRFSYAYSINRPEFREIAPYVYYDFESFSNFEGNINLKNAYIHNLDLRYELYPSDNEIFSLSLFYKYFDRPIENSYYVVGGQYQYTYTNAKAAQDIGIEIELKKNFDFWGLKELGLTLNGSYIYSQVEFEEGSANRNRPMQGQSPYVINAGLFYQSEKYGISTNILYNVVGPRITAIGVIAQDPNEDIPNIYEMPRHLLDFNFSKKIGEYIEIKLGLKDILCSSVEFAQFPSFEKDGQQQERKQITRKYTPGININIGISANF